MTAAEFRAAHGDPTTWTTADFADYETAAELAHPAFTAAAATGRYVYGRHADGDHTVVDLITPDQLASRLDLAS